MIVSTKVVKLLGYIVFLHDNVVIILIPNELMCIDVSFDQVGGMGRGGYLLFKPFLHW